VGHGPLLRPASLPEAQASRRRHQRREDAVKIESIDKSVKELLVGSFFYIPRFQRPYAWDRENLEEFWTDTIVNSDSDYFIGSIVTYDHQDARAIVDGQQRITTILLILAALREAFKEEDLGELAKGVQTLIERKDIDNADRFVLKTETSYPFLHDQILRYGPPELDLKDIAEEKTLREAFSFFSEKLSELRTAIDGDSTLSAKKKQKKKSDDLSFVRNKILGLRTISVELDSEDDAYIIFETLNTRGKDLTAGQLAKNLFARILKPVNKQLDPVSRKWDKIQEEIETSSVADISLDSFLLHYWISRYEYVNHKKLYKSMKSQVVKSTARDILDSLVADAALYRAAFEPSYRSWRADELEFHYSLDGLSVMRVRQPAPLVLAILRAYEDKRLSRKNAAASLSAIENFYFTHAAMSHKTSSGGMSMMYGSLARQMSSGDANPVVTELKKKLAERWPSYAEFEAGFLELKSSNSFTKDRRLVRYVLLKMHRVARGKTTSAIREDDETVEHLESQVGAGGCDPAHVAMLGNLCLVSKKLNGTELGNMPPSQKSPLLAKHSVVLLDSFHKNAKQWSHAAIEARSKELAQYAFDNVWVKP
jgi:hypothetical protein